MSTLIITGYAFQLPREDLLRYNYLLKARSTKRAAERDRSRAGPRSAKRRVQCEAAGMAAAGRPFATFRGWLMANKFLFTMPLYRGSSWRVRI